MMTVHKRSATRVDIDLDGGIDMEIMTAGLDALITQARNVTNGRMLYRIGSFEMPSLGALAVELSRLPSLISLLSRFDKCAVLCDPAWIRVIAEIEGALLPGLEIRTFPTDLEEAPEEWLAEGSK